MDTPDKPYSSPLVRKLTLQQALSHMLKHAHELWDLILPGHGNNQEIEGPKVRHPAAYEAPRLTKLTPEQAKLKLLGHLSTGDQGAKDLLDLLFPEPGEVGQPRSG